MNANIRTYDCFNIRKCNAASRPSFIARVATHEMRTPESRYSSFSAQASPANTCPTAKLVMFALLDRARARTESFTSSPSSSRVERWHRAGTRLEARKLQGQFPNFDFEAPAVAMRTSRLGRGVLARAYNRYAGAVRQPARAVH